MKPSLRVITKQFPQYSLAIFCLLIMVTLSGCKMLGMGGDGKLTWQDKLKMADDFLEDQFFYDAADYYKQVLDEQPENVEATWGAAESYYYARDFRNSVKYYKKSKESFKAQYPKSTFKYALTLKFNGNYAKAIPEFEAFIKEYKDKEDSKRYKKIAILEKEGCELGLELIKNPIKVKIIEPGNKLNAAYTEIAPLPLADGSLIFSSLRSDTIITALNGVAKGYLFRMYLAKNTKRGWSRGELMPEIINAPNVDIANGAFNPDMTKFYYTQCAANNKGKMICEIFETDYENGEWKNPKKLPESINMEGFTATQPTIGPYKTGHALFFASDRPKSRGGLDIWFSPITKRGYKTPKNLGKKINTMNNEMTPYYDFKDSKLYFSSNGHPSIGGYDIFWTEGADRKWSDPVNMGYPLNSRVDDMYYSPEPDGHGGYLVSNRPGSVILKSETCCDDIFYFKWRTGWPPSFAVEGFAYDANDTTRQALPGTKFSLDIMNKDSTHVNIAEQFKSGTDPFFFKINVNKSYKINAAKEGYFANQGEVSTMGLEKSDTLHVEIPLHKLEIEKAIVIKDVFYDFDKATLRPASRRALNKLVTLMVDNPTIIVELSSHTDSKGTDVYNIDLSQRRAQSVVNYLLDAGVSEERLEAKGYGETTPIAPNTHPDGRDNPEGRQMNRRTEVKVVGKLDAKLSKEKINIEEIMERDWDEEEEELEEDLQK
ncbi:MAG: hypothetical protein COC01_03390 [Bacteroidetes bacterium]|nr:MAG: hypothetical protein COC01_03390 [Bacteroidota bacterium]